ncbi:hypothetical protein C3L33_06761, partial [Rhododendron williamsianum]
MRAGTRGRDYPRNPRTGSPPPVGRPTRESRDYPRNPRTGSPPLVSRPGRETRDFSRPYDGSHERRLRVSGDVEKPRSDYGWRLGDDDRDGQSQKQSRFNDDLSQKFQWEHLFDESKGMNGNANHSSKHYPDYGIGTTLTGVTTERTYQSGGLAETGRSGTRGEKLVSMEVERGRNFPASYPLESGTQSGYGIDGGGLSLQSQKLLNIAPHENEDLQFRDQMPADKLPARDIYKGEEFSKFYSRQEKPPFYSRDTSRYAIPSSQPQGSSSVPFGRSMDDFHDSRGDGFPARSDGFNRSSGVLTDPVPHEAYTHIPHLKSSRGALLQLDDTTEYRQVQLSGNDGTRGGYTYPEMRRSEKSEMASLSDKLYGKMAGVENDYGHVDSLGSRRVEPIKDRIVVTEGSHREHVIGGTTWDPYRSSLERPISNYLDASKPLFVSKNDGEALHHGSIHHKYDRDVYRERTNNYMREDHGYGRDAGLQPEDEILNMSSMTGYDPGLDGIDDDIQEGLTEEELEFIEQPKRMQKRKLNVETELTRKNPRSKFSNKRNISGKIHNTNPSTSVFSPSRYRNIGGTIHGVGHRNSNRVAYGGSSRNPWQLKSNGRDIKKRLGPSFRDIKRRLGPVGPGPQEANMLHPSVKKRKVQKLLNMNGDGHHESVHAEEEGPSVGNLPPAKSEPSEESEEFKQLVQGAFLKFVKQLNENPGQRRRLKKQGKAGSLKCTVCGSDSEEFTDTESLAVHACTVPKVGLRAQHLGFHRAVCSLMGWKSAEILNCQWVCQLLPDAENVALKEDLIIWPPVVFIHNSSLGDINPDGRVSVPVEMLEGILRDMGFGEKTEVCQGKPANATMVVKFSGTFSGFQEAEKLHKIYADNKHGRTEFQSINPNDTEKASASKVEEFLYGYMGIADDLDKLDFITKKRRFVRSKKEIQEIADAPLKTE